MKPSSVLDSGYLGSLGLQHFYVTPDFMFLNCALVSVSDHFDGLSNIEIGVEYLICLTTFVLKNLRRLFDKYAVARTEHGALVKSTTKIFPNFVAFSENPNFTLHPSPSEISRRHISNKCSIITSAVS